jgi:hypothetical protein
VFFLTLTFISMKQFHCLYFHRKDYVTFDIVHLKNRTYIYIYNEFEGLSQTRRRKNKNKTLSTEQKIYFFSFHK